MARRKERPPGEERARAPVVTPPAADQEQADTWGGEGGAGTYPGGPTTSGPRPGTGPLKPPGKR